MRQTRALPVCFPAKTLKAAFSYQLSAFALLPLAFAASPKEAHSPQAHQQKAES
jgi:hypothetical protein